MNPKLGRAVLVLGLVIFGFVLVAVLQSKQVELAWKLKKGQVLRYKTGTTMTGTSIEGKENIPAHFELLTHHSVLEVGPEGLATLCKSHQVPESPATFRPEKLSPFENPYQMTRRGQVIRDSSAFRRELRRVIDTIEDPDWKSKLEQLEKSNVQEPEKSKSLEDFLLPDGRVKVGAEWSASALLPMETGQYLRTQRYKLEGVEGDLARIRMEQTWELVPGSQTEFGATFKIQQRLTRDATFSVSRGVLMECLEEKKNTFDSGGKVWTSQITTRRTLVQD